MPTEIGSPVELQILSAFNFGLEYVKLHSNCKPTECLAWIFKVLLLGASSLFPLRGALRNRGLGARVCRALHVWACLSRRKTGQPACFSVDGFWTLAQELGVNFYLTLCNFELPRQGQGDVPQWVATFSRTMTPSDRERGVASTQGRQLSKMHILETVFYFFGGNVVLPSTPRCKCDTAGIGIHLGSHWCFPGVRFFFKQLRLLLCFVFFNIHLLSCMFPCRQSLPLLSCCTVWDLGRWVSTKCVFQVVRAFSGGEGGGWWVTRGGCGRGQQVGAICTPQLPHAGPAQPWLEAPCRRPQSALWVSCGI